VLNGVAEITVPGNGNNSVTTTGGELALFFFMDTVELSRSGHGTSYPGVSETVFLQIPTKGGLLPEHTVLFDDAPCSAREYAGLRGLANGNFS
jgi:hypothetical protein